MLHFWQQQIHPQQPDIGYSMIKKKKKKKTEDKLEMAV